MDTILAFAKVFDVVRHIPSRTIKTNSCHFHTRPLPEFSPFFLLQSKARGNCANYSIRIESDRLDLYPLANSLFATNQPPYLRTVNNARPYFCGLLVLHTPTKFMLHDRAQARFIEFQVTIPFLPAHLLAFNRTKLKKK